jgi:hypothetical protein
LRKIQSKTFTITISKDPDFLENFSKSKIKMKIIITEEQSKMLINNIISEEENITDKTKNKKLVNKEKLTDSLENKHQ